MSEAPRYPDTEGESLEKRVNLLEDYIVKLHRYIRYANEHISSRNLTKTLRGKILKIDDIDGLSLTVKKADGTTSEVNLENGILDLQGLVFNILSSSGENGTTIDAGNIKTGTIKAISIEGCNISSSDYTEGATRFSMVTLDGGKLYFWECPDVNNPGGLTETARLWFDGTNLQLRTTAGANFYVNGTKIGT